MKKIVCILIVTAFFGGCKKDHFSNNQGPSITLSSPRNKEEFSDGEIVTISAIFADPDGIQKIQIHVDDISANVEVLHDEDNPGTIDAAIWGNFYAQAGTTYAIEVRAEDMEGNESNLDITVKGK